MIHVFIDTNIFLEYFSFAPDDLEELKKLQVAVASGEVHLWTTSQVKDEFVRNREEQVAKSLKALRDTAPSKQSVPHIARALAGFADLNQAKQIYGEKLNKLEGDVLHAYEREDLAADHALNELWDLMNVIEVEEEIFSRACHRVECGNPPGKKGSVGDAINWEALLTAGPNEEKMYLVSNDKDFRSSVQDGRIKDVLLGEWRAEKKGEVVLYRRLSDFFADIYPSIKLASDLERELRVRALVASNSFEETHRAVQRLAGEGEFSEAQVDDLFEAAIANSQIRWIASDADVNGFFRGLFDVYGERLDLFDLTRFNRLYRPEDSDGDGMPGGLSI